MNESSRYSFDELREESDTCLRVTCGHHGLVPVHVTCVSARDLRLMSPLTLTVERRASPTSMVKSPFAGFPAYHIEDIRLLCLRQSGHFLCLDLGLLQ